MKVALLIPSLENGGAEVMIASLANGLDARGWAVTLVNVSGRADERVVGSLRSSVEQLSLRATPYSLVGVLRYLRLVRSRQWDVLIHHLTPTLLHGAVASLGGAAKLIYVEHSPLTGPPGRRRLREIVARPFYACCRHVVCVSDFIRLHYFGRFFKALVGRTVTIHNGINTSRMAQAVASVDVHAERSRWSIPSERPVAVVVGRLAPVKGHAELLQALARAVAAGATCPLLLFVGDGPSRPALEQLVGTLGLGEHVRFTGSLANVAQPLAVADVVVIPSKWEGLPMSLLEAMAAARPTVAVDVGGIREVITTGAGVLVPAGDHDRLVTEMLRLLAKPAEQRKEIGAVARLRVAGEFDEVRMIDAYDALLTKVASYRGEATI